MNNDNICRKICKAPLVTVEGKTHLGYSLYILCQSVMQELNCFCSMMFSVTWL